jgi:integrase
LAWARKRRRKSGIYWSMIEDDGTSHKCGKGKKAGTRAKRWAARLNELTLDAKAGTLTPSRCLWTLADLRKIDLEEAANRGLRTALPQLGPKSKSKRASQWDSLEAGLGAEASIDDITPELLRSYRRSPPRIGRRMKGPAAVNRDLAVLAYALAIARNREAESGYRDDPFAKLEPLDEKRARRLPIALKEKDALAFLRLCWNERHAFGAFVEELFLTASRVGQRGTVAGRFLRYPPQKRGIPRSFPLRGRLRTVAKAEHVFSMKLWNRAAAAFGRPDLNPHDLRHSRLTIEGNRPGCTLFTLQKFGGWKDPMIGRVYLHPDFEAIDANLPARRSRSHGVQVARGKTRKSRKVA